MKLEYCLHSHTYRCGHASGEDEQYVQEAIKAGIKVLGFSDHIFFPGISQPGTRGDFSCLETYISSVKSLKEKYKDQIEILLGFECEYMDEYLPYYKELKTKYGFDYLICGQHFLKNGNKFLYLPNTDDVMDVYRYYDDVEKAVKSGLFTYLAHPDLFFTVFNEYTSLTEEISYKICRLCKQYDMPLEINLNGMGRISHKLIYPDERFWKIAGIVGNKVVIGYDAHYPQFYREKNLVETAFKIVERYNLNLLNKEEIVKLIN